MRSGPVGLLFRGSWTFSLGFPGPDYRLSGIRCRILPSPHHPRPGGSWVRHLPSIRGAGRPYPTARSIAASLDLGWILSSALISSATLTQRAITPSRCSRYVRFNTMQAIVLDVLLIFPDILELRDPQSADSTVFFFFFLLVSLVYGSTACLLSQIPSLPVVAYAADRQQEAPAQLLWLCSAVQHAAAGREHGAASDAA
uniref:Protein TIC 20 n=1 Tax=Ananas comosus var. bracteatus TaxID=296719 RepID=A0A6V7P725_ANACO|nr:unnamed protein product [Ananas comosus var. bracteatus]